ncbi:MAG: SCO family protein [Stellaceae bacterium]
MHESVSEVRRPDKSAGSSLSRRQALGLVGTGLSAVLLAGCNDDSQWHAMNIAGSTPALAFTMTRAADGKTVTQADYRGEIVLLYFGYTYCPDICPTTLANVAEILKRLGPEAMHIRVLFVTVDPNRDTLPVLAQYVKDFAPEIDGLRGTPDQLAALARRYRVVYSVEPTTKDHPYEVTHSSAIYVFDGSGAARLLIPSLATTKPDIAGTTADLRRLVEAKHPPSLLTRLLRLV